VRTLLQHRALSVCVSPSAFFICVVVVVDARKMLGNLFAKCGRWGLVVVQYGCIAHCVFEFITEFVVVGYVIFFKIKFV